MNQQENSHFIETLWENSIIPTLKEYIKIPNKSPHFDPDWQKHGYMQQAVKLLSDWCKENAIPNMKIENIQLENRTPIILIDIPGSSQNDTILLYGHLDKQPEMVGWDSDLGPFKPVLRGDRLYGRGAADDGYAIFASLAAIKSLHAQNIPYARCVILIESCEESGSYDLPYYIEALKDKIGKPSLVVCLDSGCENYDQLWVTTSLRGLVSGTLSISILKQGIHSGFGGGFVPSPFRILRMLLSRIEDEQTGDIDNAAFNVTIPDERIQQATVSANALGNAVYHSFPLIEGALAEKTGIADLLLRRTWKPALAVIGCDHIPSIENAGNVILPSISCKLSLRLPPTTDSKAAGIVLKKLLEDNPPYHANVTFNIDDNGDGWNAPREAEWLTRAADRASNHYFGNCSAFLGEGGSIPFMGMLGKRYPDAQFLITGVLGPESNAHGPNEFLHIPTGKKLSCCVAEIIAEHYQRS